MTSCKARIVIKQNFVAIPALDCGLLSLSLGLINYKAMCDLEACFPCSFCDKDNDIFRVKTKGLVSRTTTSGLNRFVFGVVVLLVRVYENQA